MSPVAQDLIKSLLEPNANKRLGSKGSVEVKKHPFFKGNKLNKIIVNINKNFILNTKNIKNKHELKSNGKFNKRCKMGEIKKEESSIYSCC